MERDLKGTSFVFVGGSGGIASAALLEIAKRGARILVVARRAETAQGLLEDAAAAGAADAGFLKADLSTRTGMDAAAEGIRNWTTKIHGLIHSAMSVPKGKKRTDDGLEWVYALQFLARARLNVALADLLDASGDGRVVHIGAKVPAGHRLDWNDLQLERRWSLFPALMNSQKLGYLHVQEAQRRWQKTRISLTIACVGPTRTPAIASEPLWVRLLYRLIATTPEKSARNVVRLLTTDDILPFRGAVVFDPGTCIGTPLAYGQAEADKAWNLLEPPPRP